MKVRHLLSLFIGIAGGLSAALVWSRGMGRVANLVNYQTIPLADASYSVLWLGPLAALLSLIWLGRRVMIGRPALSVSVPVGSRQVLGTPASLPLLLPIVAAALELGGATCYFLTLGVTIFGVGWCIDRLGRDAPAPLKLRNAKYLAPVVLAAAIIAATIWHGWMQYQLWRGLMLGYADFGLFTTELEHCLPWKDVGEYRFAHTRMGYHWIPLFYLLAPIYAILRTPVFLMIVGPLALNLAAVPFYVLAKSKSGSRGCALLVALAWLLLPSLSRLPYANTYGFQSIYLAVPWLSACFCLAFLGRWRWSHLCLAVALLCEETVCGVAFSWGVYLLVFGRRRKDGLVIMAAAVGYLVLTAAVLIPMFAEGCSYSRVDLFGDLRWAEVWPRMTRREVPWYLMTLLLPFGVGLWRQWRMFLIALPTLMLVLLLANPEYLNLKYWHQGSLLPVFMTMAVLGVASGSGGANSAASTSRGGVGPALAVLVSALLFHQHWGYSPLAQPYHVQQAELRAISSDSRVVAIGRVRSRFPREAFVAIATERLAAHFIDYRMVWTVSSAPWERMENTQAVLIVDTADGWDRAVQDGSIADLIQRAHEIGFAEIDRQDSLLVMLREAHPQ